jgi:hypothetical protein
MISFVAGPNAAAWSRCGRWPPGAAVVIWRRPGPGGGPGRSPAECTTRPACLRTWSTSTRPTPRRHRAPPPATCPCTPRQEQSTALSAHDRSRSSPAWAPGGERRCRELTSAVAQTVMPPASVHRGRCPRATRWRLRPTAAICRAPGTPAPGRAVDGLRRTLAAVVVRAVADEQVHLTTVGDLAATWRHGARIAAGPGGTGAGGAPLPALRPAAPATGAAPPGDHGTAPMTEPVRWPARGRAIGPVTRGPRRAGGRPALW